MQNKIPTIIIVIIVIQVLTSQLLAVMCYCRVFNLQNKAPWDNDAGIKMAVNSDFYAAFKWNALVSDPLDVTENGVISVVAALYGRADRETCSEGRPQQQLNNTECSQQGTVDVLRRRYKRKDPKLLLWMWQLTVSYMWASMRLS